MCIEVDDKYSPSATVFVSASGAKGKRIVLPSALDEDSDPLPSVGARIELRKDKKAGVVFFKYK